MHVIIPCIFAASDVIHDLKNISLLLLRFCRKWKEVQKTAPSKYRQKAVPVHCNQPFVQCVCIQQSFENWFARCETDADCPQNTLVKLGNGNHLSIIIVGLIVVFNPGDLYYLG